MRHASKSYVISEDLVSIWGAVFMAAGVVSTLILLVEGADPFFTTSAVMVAGSVGSVSIGTVAVWLAHFLRKRRTHKGTYLNHSESVINCVGLAGFLTLALFPLGCIGYDLLNDYSVRCRFILFTASVVSSCVVAATCAIAVNVINVRRARRNQTP